MKKNWWLDFIEIEEISNEKMEQKISGNGMKLINTHKNMGKNSNKW